MSLKNIDNKAQRKWADKSLDKNTNVEIGNKIILTACEPLI